MEVDAINFGTNNNDGTARFIATGGAMSAIGGDISSISYNPAGVGVYNSSVIILTPSFEVNKSNAVFQNSSRQDFNSKFYFSNVGAVFYMKNKRFSPIRNYNLGLAMNTTNSFDSKYEFRLNTKNSITKNWVNEALAINGNEDKEFDYDNFTFETVGAYNTWLVNYDTTLQTYNTPITNEIFQKSLTETKGGKRDYAISMGANVLNKLYLGVTVALPYLNYTRTTILREEDKKNINGYFEDFKLTQKLKTEGSGANIKFGAIYKPVSFLRLSASIQSQTSFTLREVYTSDFETKFDTISYENKSSEGKFQYNINTPWRVNAGIAFVHKKLGFLSFDYEMVDYTSTKYRFDEDYSDYEDELNNNIKKKYQKAHNFKVGAEIKVKKYRFRAGYNMQTSPLKNDFREEKFDFSRQQFSGGVGYLWKKISLDATYRYTMSNQFELSYDGTNGIYKNNDSQLFVVTVGFKISK